MAFAAPWLPPKKLLMSAGIAPRDICEALKKGGYEVSAETVHVYKSMKLFKSHDGRAQLFTEVVNSTLICDVTSYLAPAPVTGFRVPPRCPCNRPPISGFFRSWYFGLVA